MIFHPQNLKKTEGSFVLPAAVSAVANPCMDKDILKEYWHNFSFETSALQVAPTDAFTFVIGDAPNIPLDGCDYSINVTKNGVCVYAESAQALLHGYMTLLDQIKAIDADGEVAACIECCEVRESPLIRNRMVHFCIFPETELWELQRFVRFCGALKYTHIVLEFWGMLKYDCMKELSWPHAFTKEQVKPIIREAKNLGMEIIPMFNHWGHASACRGNSGKHVVLNQNPALQIYFNEDGWCWDITSPKVRSLLRQVRCELIELCGEGNYFHIGCDEAFTFDISKEEDAKTVCDYFNEICEELKQQGRRTILWGDMFLFKHSHYNPANRYACFSPTPESEQFMLNYASKDLLIADWQYNSTQAPVETSSVFTNAGFDCMICPWDRGTPQLDACITTAKESGLFGVLHTTWNTLSKGTPHVLLAAVKCLEKEYKMTRLQALSCSAALLRRVFQANGEYEKCGWGKHQI